MSWFLTTFPLAFWWGLLAYLAVAAVALWVGYRVGVAHVVPVAADPKAMTLTEQYERGWTMGRLDMRQVAESALEEFPTSLGGRAIVRALGGTVRPINRKRASTEGADA